MHWTREREQKEYLNTLSHTNGPMINYAQPYELNIENKEAMLPINRVTSAINNVPDKDIQARQQRTLYNQT